jgi:hypothetical protein
VTREKEEWKQVVVSSHNFYSLHSRQALTSIPKYSGFAGRFQSSMSEALLEVAETSTEAEFLDVIGTKVSKVLEFSSMLFTVCHLFGFYSRPPPPPLKQKWVET